MIQLDLKDNMLEKFRDLSAATKITVMVLTLLVAIGAIFALGFGIKALTDTLGKKPTTSETVTPSKSPSPSESVAPDYSEDQEQIDSSNPDTVGSDKDDVSLQKGYTKAEEFILASCNINTANTSYKEYYNKLSSFFGKGMQPIVMSESLYGEIKTRSCEIEVGQPQGQTGENRYLNVMAVSTTSEYKVKTGKVSENYPYNITMGMENGKWVVYGASIG